MFYSIWLDLSRVVSEIFNVGNIVTLKSGSKVTQLVIESGTIRKIGYYGFLLVFYSNFMHRF